MTRAGACQVRKSSQIRVALFLVVLFLVLNAAGYAQQEDTDTDTTLLVIRVEKAVSLQIIGTLNPTIITVIDASRQFIALGSLSLLTLALGDYRVVASAESPSTFGFNPALIELRVSEINGVFVPGSSLTQFAAVGSPILPLTLWQGINNAGTRTIATVEARLNLSQLRGNFAPDTSILLNFTVVEEG